MFLIYNNYLRVDTYDPWKLNSDPSSDLGGDRRQIDKQTDRHTYIHTQTHFGWGRFEISKLVASLTVWNNNNNCNDSKNIENNNNDNII